MTSFQLDRTGPDQRFCTIHHRLLSVQAAKRWHRGGGWGALQGPRGCREAHAEGWPCRLLVARAEACPVARLGNQQPNTRWLTGIAALRSQILRVGNVDGTPWRRLVSSPDAWGLRWGGLDVEPSSAWRGCWAPLGLSEERSPGKGCERRRRGPRVPFCDFTE